MGDMLAMDTMDMDIPDWDTMVSVRLTLSLKLMLRLIPTTDMDTLALDMLVLDTLDLVTPGLDTLALDMLAVDTTDMDIPDWDTMASVRLRLSLRLMLRLIPTMDSDT